MQSSHLQSLGHVTKISEGDADTLIASTVMDSATIGQAAVVVAEDMTSSSYSTITAVVIDRTMDWLRTMDWQPFS